MDLNRIIEDLQVLHVCEWLSKKLSVDVKIIRIVFIVITLMGIGTPIVLYLILFIVMSLSK